MCVKSYLHFTKCDHVFTSLTTCPTYHKQKESTKGLLRCLFLRSPKKKKENCGKVVPHHFQNHTYCQSCSIRKDQFTAQGVGHGALKVRRQGSQEIFREENKEAARVALQKAEKYRRHGGKSNHDIIHTETSVWLSDLYYHPETLARKDAYAREAARAPPVSSHHSTESRAGAGTRTQGRHPGESRHAESRIPQPATRPTQVAPTRQYSGRFTNHVPSSPSAVSHSPHTPRDNRPFATRAGALARPELRRTTGNTGKGPNEQPVSPRQAYADGEVNASQAKQEPSTPRTIVPSSPRPSWERNPSRWETRKASISSWIERAKAGERTSVPTDSDSDISFVCQTSKAISDQQPPKSARHSRHRSTSSAWLPHTATGSSVYIGKLSSH
ncbi:hypothetical protein F4859DRAFT_501323 [Xylaria cf. heliscus]|nr:hypothetical protein F4859DRAFT_501323 [Xylaria cf. heliscus]